MSNGEQNSLSMLLNRSLVEWRDPISALHLFVFYLSTGPVFLAQLCSHLITHKPDFIQFFLHSSVFFTCGLKEAGIFQPMTAVNFLQHSVKRLSYSKTGVCMAMERIQANQKEEISII